MATPGDPTTGQGPDDATLVLVPDDEAARSLAGVPGLRTAIYDPASGDVPEDGRAAEAILLSNDPGHADAVFALLGRLSRLRLAQTLSAGYESWDGRLPDGVLLSNNRGAHGGSTGEWVVAALLAVVRDLPAFVRKQDAREWDQRGSGTLLETRVLVLGAGDIGLNVRDRLVPFGVEVLLGASRARDGVLGPDDVPGVLGDVDAVVLVLPLTDATEHLVDAAFLGRMRDGAILVNAGRGALVDTDALVAELSAGRLRAALDVTDPEPLPDDHPLWSAPGLLLTPHVGGVVDGWRRRALAVAGEQLRIFAAGGRPENVVGD
ncbi:NAD(P)-dependent oxidoreductase [Patulibacter sp. NPDC049589]|uniref:NAD(P)-dependent oxidoreductase n=1 Tax=Patulibacter sp. NPDC049589 TaxID=3154731 RepID=UPI00341B58A2